MNSSPSATAPANVELNKEELDKVLDAFDIPTCPALVSEVMQEARKDEPDLRRLANIISSDVGMSGITLKMANSALFRSGNQVDNVQSALQRLGMRNVLSVVLGVALRSSMSGLPPEFIEKFWARSSALALSAGMIARRQYGIS
ncbi:MAG TPA: HDOD domain-containing protein, partial [Rhodocyclaceae bacterium]|nr:HDOD domain-containing protein [Rhodocyclaceae bacterium]